MAVPNHIPANNLIEEPMDVAGPINNPFDPYVPPSPPQASPFVEPESARDFSVIRPPMRNLDLDMPDIMPSTSRGSANYYTIKVQYGIIESSYETTESSTVGM